MKKILIIIIFLLVPINVIAKNEYIKEQDITDNIEIDYSDFIIEYSDWKIYDETINIETLNIEYDYYYTYQELKPIRYIKIHSAYGYNNEFQLKEIEVYNLDQKLEYTPSCTTCYIKTLPYINDNSHEEIFKMFNNAGIITLDLNKNYYINDLTIKIDINDNENYDERLIIDFTNSPIFKYKVSANKLLTNIEKEIDNMTTYKVDKTWNIYDEAFDTVKYSSNNINVEWYRKVNTIKKYRTFEYLYKYHYIDNGNNNTYEKEEIKQEINNIEENNEETINANNIFSQSNNENNNKIIKVNNNIIKDKIDDSININKSEKSNNSIVQVKETIVPKPEKINKSGITKHVTNRNVYKIIISIFIIILFIYFKNKFNKRC